MTIPRDAGGGAISVFARVEEDARRGLAVAARAAGLLVEALDALGHAPVHDESYVLLVNAHAERRRRDNDVVSGSVGEPFLLARQAFRGGEAGVVRGGADAVGAQAGGQGVAVGAEGGVDDAGDGVGAGSGGAEFGGASGVGGAAGVDGLEPGEEGEEAGVAIVGGEADFVVEVWAGGGCGEGFHGSGVKAECGDDVGADGGGGGCGEADDGDGAVGGAEVGEVRVGGAEVVAPFGDAVGFVDGDAGELALGVVGVEVAWEVFGEGDFGGDV